MKIKNDPKSIWLIWASFISLFVIGIYIFLHLIIKGQEEIYLNKYQLNAINTMIANTKDTLKTQVLIINYLKTILPIENNRDTKEFIETYSIDNISTILPTYPFKVKSFFWLTGSFLFLEIVFWSLFGLMANLMYGVTIAEKFEKKRVPEHIGKIFYAPFCSIVIYLSLNALINSGSISLEGVGKSVIVLSFILGFFTRRTILLLNKIKNLILPEEKEDEENGKDLPKSILNEIKGTIKVDKISDEIFQKYIERAVLKITSLTTNHTAVINSDKGGMFSFKNIPTGNYRIEAELVIDKTRYYEESQIQISNDTKPIKVNLSLKKSELILK